MSITRVPSGKTSPRSGGGGRTELVQAKASEAGGLASQLRAQAATVLVGAQATTDRSTPARTVGGLYGAQSSLAMLAVGREGTLPVSLRNTRGGQR